MIIIINGPCGIGKTSVAWELNSRFERAVMLDGDYIGAVHPFEIYDDARIDYLYKTLAHLVAFHQEQGDYHNAVINYVFESPESLADLCDRLAAHDPDIHTFRLIASEAAIEARIRAREHDDNDLRWHLNRYRELNAIQEQAAQRGHLGTVIDTSNSSVAQVVNAIWAHVHMHEPYTHPSGIQEG